MRTESIGLIIAFSLCLAGCGQGPQGPKGEAGAAGPPGEKGGTRAAGANRSSRRKRRGRSSRSFGTGSFGRCKYASRCPYRLRHECMYSGM